MKCRHKKYSGGFGCHCLRCGEYKYKKGVKVVYKLRFIRFATFMTIVMLLCIGVNVGLGLMILKIGGSWKYKFEELQKTASIMSKPQIIKNELVDHRHTGISGRVYMVIE